MDIIPGSETLPLQPVTPCATRSAMRDVKELLRSRCAANYPHGDEVEKDPESMGAPERLIPLQNLLLAGHPDRRYELLDGRIPCVVAFGSEDAAEQRFREWAIENRTLG